MAYSRRSSFAKAPTYASLALLYLALWTSVAVRVGVQGPAGLDFDRRGAAVLSAVSMMDCAGILLIVPLLGLARGSRTARMAAAAVFLATSGLVAVLAFHSARVAAADAASSRVLLLTIAAAAFGAAHLSRALCSDIHDAAGVAYGTLVLAAGGAVFAAPLLARVPESSVLIPSLLLANPFVATASATAFDVLRTDALYRATPIGQRLFEYPSWSTAAALYSAVAVVCVAASVFVIRSREARCV